MIFTEHQLLGETLKQAGLIDDLQIKIVLADRQKTKYLRIGEIMAIKGWVDCRTADFFAEEWYDLIVQTDKKPLGYYLERAGLLTKQQIKLILEEQNKIWVKFGSVAVLQGLVKQKTVDFFLKNLFPLEALDSPLIGKKDSLETTNIIASSESAESETEKSKSQKIDYDDIPWID